MKSANNKILIIGGASGIGPGLTERFIQDSDTITEYFTRMIRS